MLPDPFTVPAAAPTPALVMRVFAPVTQGQNTGYLRRTDDGIYQCLITHDMRPNKTEKHYVKVSETKDVTNPYTGGIAQQTSFAAISFSFAPLGWTAAQKAALAKAVIDTILDPEVTIASVIAGQS